MVAYQSAKSVPFFCLNYLSVCMLDSVSQLVSFLNLRFSVQKLQTLQAVGRIKVSNRCDVSDGLLWVDMTDMHVGLF